MLGSMRFMCCPLLVLSDYKNLVIPERYVYSRSLGIKSLGGRQQRRYAWSICHGLCKSLLRLGLPAHAALRARLEGSEPDLESETKTALTRKEASMLHRAIIT